MTDELRFDGRVAIVTGAGNGLGREYARVLASRGAKVVVNDVGAEAFGGGSDPSVAKSVVDAITRAGGIAVANTGSVADGGTSIVQTALDEFGRVDIVVTNAGFQGWGAFRDTPDALFRGLFDVHLYGAWSTIQAAWPHFVEQNYGRIVAITSSAGLFGYAGVSAYGTVKAANIGLVRSLWMEGQDNGININLLAPGARTRIHDGFAQEWKDWTDDHMRAEFPAQAVAYLAHESCNATGRIFTCLTHRLAEVVLTETAGLDLPPDQWSAEAIRDGWASVESREGEYRATDALDLLDYGMKRMGLEYPEEGAPGSE